MATAGMQEKRMDVTYKNKRKRIPRIKNIDELFYLIECQFQLDEDTFGLKGKIKGKEYEIESQDDVDDLMIEAEELVAYPKEEHHDGVMCDDKTDPHKSRMYGKNRNKLYIKHLHSLFEYYHLRQDFAVFGDIDSFEIATDNNGKNKDFGYVCFRTAEDADRAMKKMDGHVLSCFDTMHVRFAKR